MKRWIPAVAVLLLIAAAPAFALDSADQPSRSNRGARTVIVVNDVIRMAQAGVSDEAIVSYVRNLREPFDVSADDLIAMTDAHVSQAVVKVVVDEAAGWKDREPARERETATRRTVYVTAPYYDPWYYDPFFYGPRVSFGFGFGFHRGFVGFRGRRHH